MIEAIQFMENCLQNTTQKKFIANSLRKKMNAKINKEI